jgi:hypothetical protein
MSVHGESQASRTVDDLFKLSLGKPLILSI